MEAPPVVQSRTHVVHEEQADDLPFEMFLSLRLIKTDDYYDNKGIQEKNIYFAPFGVLYRYNSYVGTPKHKE